MAKKENFVLLYASMTSEDELFVLKKDSNKNKSAKNNAIINATMQITGLTNLNLTSAMSVDIDTGCSYVNTIRLRKFK